MKIVLKILFTLTLLELFLGGGGRIFEIGGATARIVLFFINIMVVSIVYLYGGKIPKHILFLSIYTLLILFFYGALGWWNGAQPALIFEDIKPLSYFLSVIFFSFYINSEKRILSIISLLKKTSLLIAFLYLTIQVLFYFGKIDFLSFYDYANNEIASSEFFFRGTEGLFFYKGFLYMVIGLIAWIHADTSKFKTIAIFIIIVAMILSGTRGFILMFGILYALFYGVPLLLKLNFKILILAAVLMLGSLYFFKNVEIGNKNLSDSVRIEQTKQVAERIDPFSLFIGHGFGNGVPVRMVHMEIGYLEVFHKQGLVGLGLWVIFFVFLYNAYIKKRNYLTIRKVFFLSALFVLLISLTNPFFNNPIGISLFIISLSVFLTLNKMGEKNYSTSNK